MRWDWSDARPLIWFFAFSTLKTLLVTKNKKFHYLTTDGYIILSVSLIWIFDLFFHNFKKRWGSCRVEQWRVEFKFWKWKIKRLPIFRSQRKKPDLINAICLPKANRRLNALMLAAMFTKSPANGKSLSKNF